MTKTIADLGNFFAGISPWKSHEVFSDVFVETDRFSELLYCFDVVARVAQFFLGNSKIVVEDSI